MDDHGLDAEGLAVAEILTRIRENERLRRIKEEEEEEEEEISAVAKILVGIREKEKARAEEDATPSPAVEKQEERSGEHRCGRRIVYMSGRRRE
jgi:hypothetical protein